MPTTKEIQIYTFEELSPEAKQKAIEWYRNCLYEDSSYSDMLVEDFEQVLSEIPGFELERKNMGRWKFDKDGKKVPVASPCIYFSLGHCQGDGVAFDGRITEEFFNQFPETKKILKRWRKNKWDIDVSFDVYNPGHYFNVAVKNGVVEAYNRKGEDKATEEDFNTFEVTLENWCREMQTTLEQLGYDYFEYVYSDESISENIIANEYEFLESGARW